MKKKILIITLIVLSFVIFAGAIIVGGRYLLAPNSGKGTKGIYKKEIKILNESYPSDIIVFGEDVGFDPTLKFRTITKITEENLTSDKKFKYTFFVINDRAGKLNITDEEFLLCKRLCEENDLNFFYIGTQYLEKLKELGYYDYFYSEGQCGFGYIISPFGNDIIEGMWTTTEEEIYKRNPNLLGQILTYEFVYKVIGMMNNLY